MSNFIVIYDACILYSASLRNLFMYLAGSDLFQAKWTNQIHEEWMQNLLLNKPDLNRQKLERVRDLMNSHVYDALVEDYEFFMPGLNLPDPDDTHVLAAAIRCRASVIVAFNLKDFPLKTLERYDLQAQHPDEFFRHLLDLSPSKILRALKALRTSLKNPPFFQ